MNTSSKIAVIPHWQNLSLENLEGEVWKEIPNYEGVYSVSNLGRIKSLERDVNYLDRFTRKKYAMILSTNQDNNGYVLCRLMNRNIGKTFRVHRVVALAFIGESNLFIDHINEIKWDNRLVNIEYVNYRENCHRYQKNRPKKEPIGVSKVDLKYRSAIFYNRKYNLGTFETIEDAKNAYDKALGDLDNLHLYESTVKKERPDLPRGITYRNDTKRYSIRKRIDGKYKSLGCFKTKNEAIKRLEEIQEEMKQKIKKLNAI